MAWLVIVCQPSVKHRRILSVGKSICMSFGITDVIYPSVIMAWLVIIWQLSVKYRRIFFVGNSVGMYLKYIKK
jgi:hypothetical protein